jgi:hypothetical protein
MKVGRRFGLYLVKVYFQGTSGSFKKRPILIIDDSEAPLVTFAEITSQGPGDPPKYFDSFKEELKTWQSFGLDKHLQE